MALHEYVLKPESNIQMIKSGSVPTGFIFGFRKALMIPSGASTPLYCRLSLDLAEYAHLFQDIGSLVFNNSGLENCIIKHDGSGIERFFPRDTQTSYPYNQDYSNVTIMGAFREGNIIVRPASGVAPEHLEVMVSFKLEVHSTVLPYFSVSSIL